MVQPELGRTVEKWKPDRLRSYQVSWGGLAHHDERGVT